MIRLKRTIYNTQFKCLICEKEVVPLEKIHTTLFDIFRTLQNVLEFSAFNDWNVEGSTVYRTGHPKSEMTSDGLMDVVSAGYGSVHDGDVMLIALCDECITKKIASGALIYDHNAMFPDEDDE